MAPVLPRPLRRAVQRTRDGFGRVLEQASERHPTQVMSDRTFVETCYRILLGRPSDDPGMASYLDRLSDSNLSRSGLPAVMMASDEFWQNRVLRMSEGLIGVHRSRCLFVQQLPRARHILDLGGTHQQNPAGAFVSLGYPYPFERLVIVDLPPEQRHPLYQLMTAQEPLSTDLGPVEYSLHSMADLSRFDDDSFDLVYSGQTFEHVPPEVGDQVLAEVHRVLRPGGHLALDTPNGAACRLQLAGTGETVTNPDHDIEYEHAELSAKIESAGLVIERQFGLTFMPRTFAESRFVADELHGVGLFDDIERCYLLAYLCRKP